MKSLSIVSRLVVSARARSLAFLLAPERKNLSHSAFSSLLSLAVERGACALFLFLSLSLSERDEPSLPLYRASSVLRSSSRETPAPRAKAKKRLPSSRSIDFIARPSEMATLVPPLLVVRPPSLSLSLLCHHQSEEHTHSGSSLQRNPGRGWRRESEKERKERDICSSKFERKELALLRPWRSFFFFSVLSLSRSLARASLPSLSLANARGHAKLLKTLKPLQ